MLGEPVTGVASTGAAGGNAPASEAGDASNEGGNAGAGVESVAGSASGAPAKRARIEKKPGQPLKGQGFQSPAVAKAAADAAAAQEARKKAVAAERERVKAACAQEVKAIKEKQPRGVLESKDAYDKRIEALVAAVKLKYRQGPDSAEAQPEVISREPC